MNNQTTVQWLKQQIADNNLSLHWLDVLLQQALIMEKQQIIDAFNGEPQCDGDGEKYFNDNYNLPL